MSSKAYTLVVQNAQEERQIRRLGAAVCLIWNTLPITVQELLITQASAIHISGETAEAEDIRSGILSLAQTGLVEKVR